MDAEYLPTAPLPAVAREPLIVVLDAREARCRWVACFLAFANYHGYVPHTTFEAFRWFVQHPVSPQAILLISPIRSGCSNALWCNEADTFRSSPWPTNCATRWVVA